MDWEDDHGVEGGEHPLLADAGWAIGGRFETDGGIPTMTLLGPGAVVLTVDEMLAADDIEAALP